MSSLLLFSAKVEKKCLSAKFLPDFLPKKIQNAFHASDATFCHKS